jgi:hypothetical protein
MLAAWLHRAAFRASHPCAAQADLDKAKKTLLTALQMDPDDGDCQRDLRLVKKLHGLHTAGNEAFEVRLWLVLVCASWVTLL